MDILEFRDNEIAINEEMEWAKENCHNTFVLFVRIKKNPKKFTERRIKESIDRAINIDDSLNNINPNLLYKCMYSLIFSKWFKAYKETTNKDLIIVDSNKVDDITKIEEYALDYLKTYTNF